MIEKILLDTDIGTDIDDAIVMSYLLKQKKCETSQAYMHSIRL